MNSVNKNYTFENIIFILIITNIFLGKYIENLLIFNYPLNQLILIIFLFKIKFIQIIKDFLINIKYGHVLFFYLLFSFIQLLFYTIENGIFALRDGLYIINFLYLFIGYYYSVNCNFNRLKNLFKVIIFLSFIYIFLNIIDYESPIKLISVLGNSYNLINYGNLSIACSLSILILTIYHERSLKDYILIIILILFSIIILQQRVIYLIYLILFIYLLKLKIITLANSILNTLLLFLLLSLFITLDFTIKGRLDVFNFNFLMDHFLSIFTPIINDEYSTLNYQGSVNDRLNWWSEIINKSFSTVKLFIIGNGFGMRVIDFSSVNILIREPHNMLLTIIARQGYFGLFLFMIIQFLFFKTFISKINLVKNEKDFNQSFKILLILFGYILITILMSSGTSILNKSGISIPYYLFWGMIIGYNKKLK